MSNRAIVKVAWSQKFFHFGSNLPKKVQITIQNTNHQNKKNVQDSDLAPVFWIWGKLKKKKYEINPPLKGLFM